MAVKPTKRRMVSDYDTAWKEAIERFFQLFMLFFFKDIHDEIDWSRPHEFMDKELQQASPDGKTGKRVVDKLVKVWLKSGGEVWLLIHIEVQNRVQVNFPERMFIYAYRLYDKYARPVVSLAILGDSKPEWRPQGYGYDVFGTGMQHQYRAVKLLDYSDRWEELEGSDNPFALVVMAHLRTLSTVRKPEKRMEWKLRLTKGLYERGLPEEDIVELFRFIEWMMILPDELELKFAKEIEAIEEEKKMPAITPFERRAMDRGREEGALQTTRKLVVTAVEARWGSAPAGIRAVVNKIESVGVLEKLHREAITAGTLEEFERKLGG